MIDFRTVKPGTTLYIPFATFDSNDPQASATITGLAVTDIEVYKDGSVTQRASDSGYTLLDTDGIDFDGTTGIHGFSIDLSDNTTAGFYASGSQYFVVLSSITLDTATVNPLVARFTIGYPDAVLNTTIATLSTQTSFTLTSGPAEDDALNNMWCVIHDVASAVQLGHALISDYTGSTKTVTLSAATTFTIAATDNISIMGLAPLQGTTLGNKLDVTATGAAGIDWGNIENKTTANDLSGTDIQLVDTATTVTNDVGITATAIDNIYDEAIAGHLTAGTAGLYLALAGAVLQDTTVTGTPTSTTFQLTAGSTIDDFYNDQLIYIISGTGVGQVRVVLDYTGATKTVTVDEAWITTPAASDRIAILSSHVHPVSQIADGVWDEVLTGATHNVANSAGRRLRQIDAAFEVHAGTAQAGTANTITLDTGASATDNIYNGDRIIITEGTGAQEHGIVTAYNGTTKVATMSQNWVITPDATSVFEVVPADVDVETWQNTTVSNGGASGHPVVDAQAISDSTTAADNLEASALGIVSGSVNDASATTTSFISNLTEATDDHYNGRIIVFTSGAVSGQATDITDYTGATKTITITALTEAPADGVTFVIV